MRPLQRLGPPVEFAERGEAARQRGRRVVEQDRQRGHRFLEPRQARRPTGQGDTRLLVVVRQPARAEPELDATATEHVQGGRHLGQHRRMTEFIVEHQRRQADAGGVGRDQLQEHQRRVLRAHVVRDAEGRIGGPTVTARN